MLEKNRYVRRKMDSRKGTIEGSRIEGERLQYLFRCDPRFLDTLPDSYVFEDEVEPCHRPTDDEVEEINSFIKQGSEGG